MSESDSSVLSAFLYYLGAALILTSGILSLVAGCYPANPKHPFVPFSPALRKYYSPKGQRYLRISRWLGVIGLAVFGWRAYFLL